MKILKTSISIILLVFIFDLLINLILPERIKKQIGTTRNYSLKSVKFHHSIAPEIDLNELWGDKKYKIKTNELSMRIGENDNFEINNKNKYIGFVGDSFVYGSGINYESHFISKLKNNENNFLNLGYVSYSPSIYYKKIEHLIKNDKIKFKTIFLFIDHSDIQDEGQFYREDKYGNIVRKWIDDDEVKSKNKKYKVKNYLKQNSFIFKLYDNISSPSISTNTEKCINDKKNTNYRDYLDINRFGYSYKENIKNKNWVNEGINKILNYLDKIKLLSEKYNFRIILVNYPSALEVIDNISSENSKHYNFLREWSLINNITFIDTRNYFIKENDINDYLNNFIHCDVHWNKNGHQIISESIKIFVNE